MKKNILGIDMGYDHLKLVLVNGTQIKKSVSIPMPQALLKDGRVVSVEAMAELIRTTIKEHGMRCRNAALVLSDEVVYVRNVTMPLMNVEQLVYNLPYEFRDYITDELKDYIFDYAMISTEEEITGQEEKTEDEEGSSSSKTMELFAVAAPVSCIQESKDILRKAGLKMVKAAPAVCSYRSLIREREKSQSIPEGEYCILDLGYHSIRMYIFHGNQHIVSRVLEIGLSILDEAIADIYNVDVHLAHTYLLTNYDNCQNKEMCANAYDTISIELMRALNFYSFNNPNSQLSDLWICGGGAAIAPLQTAIASQLDMNIHKAEELIPGNVIPEESYALIQAIGIAIH
ncbi:MAG: pilus assembly protein PilM [Lachnospiraceae bacterium]